MAFAFFRKRQKFVIIMMVLLMIAFLMPTALKQFSGGQREYVLGKILSGREIAAADREVATHDLEVLGRMGLGRMTGRFGEMDMAFYMLVGPDQEDEGLTYALLTAEAAEADVRVTDAEVDAVFQMAGLTGPQYSSFIGVLRSEQNMPERETRAVVARWLRVYRTYQAAAVQTPPSDAELRVAFRDLNEAINLRMALLPAEQYAPNDVTPTDEQVTTLFDQNRNQPPDNPQSLESFGFGYVVPTRIRLAYLLLREDPVARSVQPSFGQVRRYWSEHQADFVRSEPADTEPASEPASGPASSQPVKTREVQMTFAEAEPLIQDLLRKEAVDPRIDDVLSLASSEVRNVTVAPDASPYPLVVAEMRQPADTLLQREIHTVVIEAETLPRAMELLSEAAKGVRGIVFPWGDHGDINLDPQTRVTLKATDITLGEALQRITEQVKMPAIEWAMCKGFPGVLFPVGGPAGVDLFPLVAGDTGLENFSDVMDDEIIGMATTSRRGGHSLDRLLPELARRNTEGGSVLPIGREGPRLYVRGEDAGGLLWRVLEFSPSHTPEKLTPAIREQIVYDWRLMQGMDAARKKAETLAVAGTHVGLEKAAENMGLKTVESGFVTRRIRTRMGPMWGTVPGLDRSLPVNLREPLIRRAFELAPKDVNKPDDTSSVEVAAIPALRTVVVWQRFDYKPALESQFETQGLPELLMMDRQIQAYRDRVIWFDPQNVRKRLGYTPKATTGG